MNPQQPPTPGRGTGAAEATRLDPAYLDPASLDLAKGEGLVPAVVQDADTLAVLMVGWMNAAAVRATQETGLVTFWSRSRQAPWVKGETSGHTLALVSLHPDCDGDTLLVLARPAGPTCHTGAASCFGDPPPGSCGVGELDRTVRQRAAERPEGSYTTRLLDGELRRIAQKVGEEGVETALAALAQGDDELAGEAADLLYHLLVLLRARGLGLADVEAVLRSRRA